MLKCWYRGPVVMACPLINSAFTDNTYGYLSSDLLRQQ